MPFSTLKSQLSIANSELAAAKADVLKWKAELDWLIALRDTKVAQFALGCAECNLRSLPFIQPLARYCIN